MPARPRYPFMAMLSVKAHKNAAFDHEYQEGSLADSIWQLDITLHRCYYLCQAVLGGRFADDASVYKQHTC